MEAPKHTISKSLESCNDLNFEMPNRLDRQPSRSSSAIGRRHRLPFQNAPVGICVFNNCIQVFFNHRSEASPKRRLLPGLIGPAFFIITFLCPSPGLTQNAISNAHANEHTATLVVHSEPKTPNSLLENALSVQLSEVNTRLTIKKTTQFPNQLPAQILFAQNIAEEFNAGAVIWTDFEQSDHAFLYLLDSQSGRLLVRKLDHTQEGEIEEAIAIIVSSAVQAINQGGQIGVHINKSTSTSIDKEPNTQSEPNIPDATKKNKSSLISLSGAYVFSSYANDFPVVNGIHGSVTIHPGPNWYMDLGVKFRQPLRISTESFRSVVRHYPIHVGIGYWAKPSKWNIGGQLNLFMNLTTNTTTTTETNGLVFATNAQLGFGITLLFRLGYNIKPNLEIFIAPGLDVALRKIAYTVEVNNHRQTLFEPWLFRPTMLAGLKLNLF